MHVSTVLRIFAFAAAWPAVVHAAGGAPSAATFITKEEVEAVNRTPGIDRTIKVVDTGREHFAVGVIHRGPSNAAKPAIATGPSCGAPGAPPADVIAGLAHDKQTEGYYILSGEGVVVTGGRLFDGHREMPNTDVVSTLNGPSCRGLIGGADVVKRRVRAGDIIIIPPDVPHGWTDVADHIDYLSFRPSGDILRAGYEHPAIRK